MRKTQATSRSHPSLLTIPLSRCDVLDTDRDDHFIRRDGSVFAGTHLIIEVEERPRSG